MSDFPCDKPIADQLTKLHENFNYNYVELQLVRALNTFDALDVFVAGLCAAVSRLPALAACDTPAIRRLACAIASAYRHSQIIALESNQYGTYCTTAHSQHSHRTCSVRFRSFCIVPHKVTFASLLQS